MSRPRIIRVYIEHKLDECPDLSHLGEYSQTPGPNAIDRQARGDMGRNELRYCNITLSGEETGNPDSVEQDYNRLEAYNRGDWNMIGVIAHADIVLTDSSIGQKISSGGLWGVESDGGDEYIQEVELDELSQLGDELIKLGCSEVQVKHAMLSVDREQSK